MFFPELAYPVQEFIRIAYAISMLGTLAFILPNWRHTFCATRFNGYANDSIWLDIFQTPRGSKVLFMVWTIALYLLMAGPWSTLGALINFILCHHFFIRMRWKSLTRGYGAPGFLCFWLGAAVLLLEYCSYYALELRPLALWVLQTDFAWIMLSAGIYKFTSGYYLNEGMEYGLVNPMWGYWWKFWKTLSPKNFLFKILNHLAWSVEIIAALLMFVPSYRVYGGALIFISFVFIVTQIRLGFLCVMVMLASLLFTGNGADFNIQDSLAMLTPASPAIHSYKWLLPFNQTLFLLLCIYFALRPLVNIGLWYNFYGKKALPGKLQFLLELYANTFGVILWRVFTYDVVHFFVQIYRREKNSATVSLVSEYNNWQNWRFHNAMESITIATIFTALKYFPNKPEIFEQRIQRYAKSLNLRVDEILEFRYYMIDKNTDGFQFHFASQFTVDGNSFAVAEDIIDVNRNRDFRQLRQGFECSQPGTYVPASTTPLL